MNSFWVGSEINHIAINLISVILFQEQYSIYIMMAKSQSPGSIFIWFDSFILNKILSVFFSLFYPPPHTYMHTYVKENGVYKQKIVEKGMEGLEEYILEC